VEDEFDFTFDMPEAGLLPDNCHFTDSRQYEIEEDFTIVQVKDQITYL
jgi:hypothetical protein